MVSSQARDILKLFRQQISHHVPPFLLKATWHSPQWWVPKLKACKLIQFTSAEILQTAISSQVPPSTILQTAPIRKNQILQTASYSQISKSCKLLSSYKYRNLANCSGSKVPKSWKLIHKFQHLANSRQFTSANILSTACHFTSAKILQTAVNSQVPDSCKLLSIHKSQNIASCSNSQVAKACRLLQFTNAKN